MTWFAEFTEFITLDGMVYPFINGERFIISEEGLGMPPVEYLTQRGPLQHGETVIYYRLAKRIIQIVQREDTCSRWDYWEARTNLINALRPNRHYPINPVPPGPSPTVLSTTAPTVLFGPGVLRKKLPNGAIRDIKVLVEQGPGFVAREEGKWDEWGFTEAIRFVAHDPTFYDPTLKEHTFTIQPSSDHLIFPFVWGVDGYFMFGRSLVTSGDHIFYNGNWLSFPDITIVGPLSDFRITNNTIEEYIGLTYTIDPGEIVTISLPHGNKTITSNLGSNLLGTLQSGSKLSTFRLECHPQAENGLNQFFLQGSGANANTMIIMSYYERFIGI